MKSPKNPFAVPFPTGWFHPRCRAPLAHRVGAVAEYLLSCYRQKPLVSKLNNTLQYVTMVSRAHWLLLRESLVSLHRSWNVIPRLTIVSDGSWEREEFLSAFNFWPEPIRILMPADILEPLVQSGQMALVALASQHPLGLKLATIIYLGREQQTLFMDSDILWFSDPQNLLVRFGGFEGPSTSVETGCAYNEELVRQFYPEGLSLPAINTGCVYLKGELCAPELLQQLLAVALKQPKHNFNEQSIIAITVEKNGRRLPPEFCLVDFKDALTIRRRQPWREGFHARHYVNWIRHQFYRDALRLRWRTFFSRN